MKTSSAHPTPHFEKLVATLANEKLPDIDKPRIEQAIARYHDWIMKLDAASQTAENPVDELVLLLNEYRNFIDIELVFDSPADFLYRQKGQLKLDNSVIEEFLPRLIHPRVLPELNLTDLYSGPASCFSSAYFASSLDSPLTDGGLNFRTKDQDFAIAKKLFIKASHDATFADAPTKFTYLAYVAAECKTNLDKTMFQEACATANDVKSAVSGARYYLLCEWLDMTPLSTAPTDIDEVIILRKAKRLSSNVRSKFGSSVGRQKYRDQYVGFLKKNPISKEMICRLVEHIRELMLNEAPIEDDVLKTGYF